jgi:hypothetical protein
MPQPSLSPFLVPDSTTALLAERRYWIDGASGLHPVARRALEKFVSFLVAIPVLALLPGEVGGTSPLAVAVVGLVLVVPGVVNGVRLIVLLANGYVGREVWVEVPLADRGRAALRQAGWVVPTLWVVAVALAFRPGVVVDMPYLRYWTGVALLAVAHTALVRFWVRRYERCGEITPPRAARLRAWVRARGWLRRRSSSV